MNVRFKLNLFEVFRLGLTIPTLAMIHWPGTVSVFAQCTTADPSTWDQLNKYTFTNCGYRELKFIYLYVVNAISGILIIIFIKTEIKHIYIDGGS